MKKYRPKKNKSIVNGSFVRMAAIFIVLFIVLPGFSTLHAPSSTIAHKERKVPSVMYHMTKNLSRSHIVGGFSINTAERATKAATDGVQVDFHYGQPPVEASKVGQKLSSLHMKVIDAYIWTLLYRYECYRTLTIMQPPVGQKAYCQNDGDSYITDENELLTDIAAHLKLVKDNQLIIGYWMLDDWVQWDAGGARETLIKIHDLIQQYTPKRPAICGFGGSIDLHRKYGWNDWIAENYSSQACDEVGIYVYSASLPYTVTSSSDAFDWSMSGVLPAMFASLQKRGWDIEKEPLIGIGQAFGGPVAHADRYWVMPNARDIEIQSRSFCQHGATSLSFYAWYDSGYGTSTQNPMNNPEIEAGIRNGIAACKQYWR